MEATWTFSSYIFIYVYVCARAHVNNGGVGGVGVLVEMLKREIGNIIVKDTTTLWEFNSLRGLKNEL